MCLEIVALAVRVSPKVNSSKQIMFFLLDYLTFYLLLMTQDKTLQQC